MTYSRFLLVIALAIPSRRRLSSDAARGAPVQDRTGFYASAGLAYRS